jgi:hypothetical protein
LQFITIKYSIAVVFDPVAEIDVPAFVIQINIQWKVPVAEDEVIVMLLF